MSDPSTLTLASLITDVTSVVTALITIIGSALDFIATHPLPVLFIGCGVAGIGIRYAWRMAKAAKRMA